MSIPSSTRVTRLTSRAFFVLLGLVIYAPSPARSSCDDHAVLHPGASALDYLSDLDSPLCADGEQSKQAPPAPSRDVPCSAPTCSRGSGVPPMPAPLSSWRSELWCCTTSILPLIGPAPDDRLADETPRHPRL